MKIYKNLSNLCLLCLIALSSCQDNTPENHDLNKTQLSEFENELVKEGFFWKINNETFLFNKNGEVYYLRNTSLINPFKTIGKWYFNTDIGTLQIAWDNKEQLEVQIEKVDKGFNKITYTGKLNEVYRENAILTKMKILDNRFDTFLKDNTTDENIPDNAIKGDFNGDGKEEFAWIIRDEEKPEDCLENCGCAVRFSDINMSDFLLNAPCMYTYLSNKGDLNDNGRDDLSITSTGFGTWGGINVYYFNGSKWKKLVETISYWSEGKIEDIIQKDESKSGYVIIKEYNENFNIVTKSVPIY